MNPLTKFKISHRDLVDITKSFFVCISVFIPERLCIRKLCLKDAKVEHWTEGASTR